MVTATTTSTTTGVTIVLRALFLALLIALVLPALALADDAPAAVLDPPALEQPSPAADGPPAEQPTPAEPVPAAEEPAPPVVEPEPTAPPATGTSEPATEAPAEPVIPPESEVVPVPPPATPPDVVITTPELVATPAVPPSNPPAKLLPVVVIPPSNADAVPGRLAGAVAPAPVGIPPAAPPTQAVTLAAGTDTPVVASPAPEQGRARPSDAAVQGLLTQKSALPQNLFSLDLNAKQARSPVAPVAATTIERGPGMALGEEGESTLFSESASAPIGTVGSGSSLLAVLAGYVLPGVGGPPASTLIMFVLVGLIVAIARAPRPQLSERLHLGALLGAASGHGLAVCRPG